MSESKLLFLEPIDAPKVWGGCRLGSSRPVPGREPIGERLIISGHPDGDCVLRDGEYSGMRLSELWNSRPQLFGFAAGDAFPLQVKLIDAGDDLSVQVHPGHMHAARLGADGPKNECWYVLEPSTCGEIIIGHRARSRHEFTRLIDAGRWNELLARRKMRAGDFYFIPAGTLHCILAGSLIYEVMQSSSTTYRFYDHGRVDSSGKGRELHLREALEVVSVPDSGAQSPPVLRELGGATETTFADNEFFRVRKWEVRTGASFAMDAAFLVASVLRGSGTFNGTRVKSGDHFIVPHGSTSIDVSGPLTLMVSNG